MSQYYYRRKSKKVSLTDDLLKGFGILSLIFIGSIFYKQYFSALIAGLICVGIILFFLYKNKAKQKYFANQKTLQDLRNLTPTEFEQYTADLFRRLGFSTEAVGGAYDGGIDVIATKDGKKHYIQCKKFINRQVSVGDVRNFYGAVVDKLFDAKSYFITTNIFTLEAERFAQDKPMELIDGKRLMELVEQVELKK